MALSLWSEIFFEMWHLVSGAMEDEKIQNVLNLKLEIWNYGRNSFHFSSSFSIFFLDPPSEVGPID